MDNYIINEITKLNKDKEFLDGRFGLKAKWSQLDGERATLIAACERYAAKTIPSEFLDNETPDYREKQVDFQSYGALMVNNLANKLASTLFPTNMPFFKAEVPTSMLPLLYSAVDEEGNTVFNSKGDIDFALSNMEKEAVKTLYKSLPRAKIVKIMKQLIITGNCLLDMSKESWKVIGLRNYVLERDEDNEVQMIVIKECKKVYQLTEDKQKLALQHQMKMEDKVNIYTGIKWQNGMFTIWQELEDKCYCHNSLGRQRREELDFVPLVWTIGDNHAYGIGHCEMYYNNLKQISDKSKQMAVLSALNANIKYLVDPAAAIDIDRLINGESGEYVVGRPDGVIPIETGVVNILNDLYVQVDALKKELAQAFLYNINVVRDAERVTAEEIRLLANEIEAGLGGNYSQISDQLQKPIAKKAMEGIIDIFKGIEILVTTGLETINKRDEASRVLEFFNSVQVLGTVPEAAIDYINFEQALKTIAANLHLPLNIINTNEQVEAMRQQRAQQEQQMMAQQAGMQEGAKAGAQMMMEQ